MTQAIEIRRIANSEYQQLGELMVAVYKQLPGFPTPKQQPKYYQMLQHIGQLNERKHTEVWVAATDNNVVGGVVYFSDMSAYGSGGTATSEKNSSGIRLLAVASSARGLGIGKLLTQHCMLMAKKQGHTQVILHTTGAMKVAWSMYEKLGFKRSSDLDFHQEDLAVFGFRLSF